jgi:RNA polymerase sigma factor (sigma-70 family)
MQETNHLEEINIINLAKNGDNDSIKTLIEKHSGICVDVYKKYINMPNVSGFVSDDIISSKDYIIYNSAKTYDPSRGSKFSTWLANQTRYFCLKSGKLIPFETETLNSLIDERDQEFKSEEKTIEKSNEVLEIVKETLSSLSDKKIKKCIEIKYFSEDGSHKSYTQIAEKMNVTVQTVINWHNKFIKIIKQKCKNRKIIFDLN